MEWAGALMAKKDPPAGKMGFGYMLMGGSDASNTDPFATEPKPGGQWVDTGPHVIEARDDRGAIDRVNVVVK